MRAILVGRTELALTPALSRKRERGNYATLSAL
jgi:hypothetical protein